MKRKALLAAVFCLIILSCVSAGRFSIVGQVSPYSLQTITLQTGRHNSSYGFGFTAGGRYNINDNLTAGLDFNLDVFNYKEIENKYLVVGFMAKAGYLCDFSDKVFGEIGAGLGLDIRKVGDRSQSTFGLEMYFGGGYRFTDRISATAGLDLEHGFQKGKEEGSADFAARLRLGAVFTL